MRVVLARLAMEVPAVVVRAAVLPLMRLRPNKPFNRSSLQWMLNSITTPPSAAAAIGSAQALLRQCRVREAPHL
jgi:hypothetical protein